MLSPAQYWYKVGEDGKKDIQEHGDGGGDGGGGSRKKWADRDKDEFSALDRQLKEYLLQRENKAKENEMAQQSLKTMQNTHINANANAIANNQMPWHLQTRGQVQGQMSHFQGNDGSMQPQLQLPHTPSELALIEQMQCMQRQRDRGELNDSSSVFSEEPLAVHYSGDSSIQVSIQIYMYDLNFVIYDLR